MQNRNYWKQKQKMQTNKQTNKKTVETNTK